MRCCWGKMPLADRMRLNAFGAIGHSRGGSYAILLSRRVPQIASIVTWGAIRSFDRFDAETRRRWRNQGFLEVPREEHEAPLRMTVAALEALERNDRRLEVLKAVRESTIPIMFLHGRRDRRVPLSEGERLWQCADPQLCRFHVIENAGHTFQTRHPLTNPFPAPPGSGFQDHRLVQKYPPAIARISHGIAGTMIGHGLLSPG